MRCNFYSQSHLGFVRPAGCLILWTLLVATGGIAQGANRYWDTSASSGFQVGSFNWTDTRWATSTAGTTLTTINLGGADQAFFGGNGSSNVTVSGNYSLDGSTANALNVGTAVAGLDVSTNDTTVTLVGNGSLTIGSPDGRLNVKGNGIGAGSGDATLNLNGPGIDVSGANGLITLNWGGGGVTGDATLNLSSGTVTAPGMRMGAYGSSATVTITDGELTLSGVVSFGAGAGTSTINFNGGEFTTTRIIGGTSGTQNLNFDGGTLKAAGDHAQFIDNNVDNVTINAGGAKIDSQAFSISVLQAIGGAGALTKLGSGTLTLSGASTYNGATIIEAGFLVQNGSHTGGGLYTVQSGGTLMGSGIIDAPLLVDGGTVAPGNSIESVGPFASIEFDGGVFAYDLDTTLLDADLLYGGDGSTLTLLNDPALSLFDEGNNDFVPLGNKFTLIAYDGTWNGGIFAGYPDDSIFSFAGNHWLINYNDDSPGSNFHANAILHGTLFVTITSVPEPATHALGLLGLAGLGMFVWRKRNSFTDRNFNSLRR